jgi:histone-binding protein RBBP4
MEIKQEDIIDEMEQSQDEENDNENDHKIWKKNAPYLYDVLITWGLDWPSLCVNWLPKVDYLKERPFYLQKLVLGTHTSGQEADYLMIGKARLPISKVVLESQSPENLSKEDLEYFGRMTNEQMIEDYAKFENKIEIETKIRHDGEVNKAKASPHEYNIIATQTNKGEIHIFDYYKFPPKPKDDTIPEPTKKLISHTKIGYGLSWSPFENNYLLSCSYDGSVCLWDLKSEGSDPLFKVKEHLSECEDVCFCKKQKNIFASCGDDKTIKIMDYREKDAVVSVVGHEAEINSIDFNPDNEFLYITGSNDKTAALWDLRKPELKLHSFIHHKNSILNVKWNNRRSNIFASSGEDNKILVWDLTQIGANIARDDNEEAPSEMIFEHGGHLDKINDFDWNQNEDMMCASVDDMNNLQIWEMNVKSIINKDISNEIKE